jgi:hypothetical protein
MAKFYTPTRLSENIAETPEGYLVCIAVPIARTGWQKYGEGETPLKVGDDGTVNVYRDPKEVFRAQTIASFQGKSITIKHPEDFVAPDNWSDLTKGTAQNVRKSDEKDEDGEECLVADLLITEKMAIQLVKNGLREVSCGYECEYEQTGEGEGRQFNIVGNHIALVEEGRAGNSYAINDHKWEGTMTAKVLEKLRAKFGAKAIDEAMAEEKKDDKAKDAGAYDELVKMVKDLGEKIDSMGKSKDEDKKEEDKPKDEDKSEKKDDESKDEEKEEKKDDSKDEDKEKEESKDDEASMEERLKALEAAVAKLLEKGAKDEDKKDESKDEDDDESEDDDFEDSDMTGDSASRVEILAPGLKVKGKDFEKKALEAAYQTKEGKKVIDALTGGKPTFDSAEKVKTLFIAASEVLKSERGNGLTGTKDSKSFDEFNHTKEIMTAEKMNELNAALWAGKK